MIVNILLVYSLIALIMTFYVYFDAIEDPKFTGKVFQMAIICGIFWPIVSVSMIYYYIKDI